MVNYNQLLFNLEAHWCFGNEYTGNLTDYGVFAITNIKRVQDTGLSKSINMAINNSR